MRRDGFASRDRAGWLEALGTMLADAAARGEDVVLACSALKAAYRAQLGDALK